MAITGQPHHLDISVGDPGRSIPFYGALLEALGYRRWRISGPEWEGPDATRATWSLRDPEGGSFGIEVRPAHEGRHTRRYDRYEPGPHHLAFHAASREVVDAVHRAMVAIDAEVLDPPTDYGGDPAYGDDYYAVFFADPDGFKLEVVCIPPRGR